MIGGWRLGNSIDGVQAEYFRVPYAQANLAKIPDDLTDEQCVLLADIASTRISAAETTNVQIGPGGSARWATEFYIGAVRADLRAGGRVDQARQIVQPADRSTLARRLHEAADGLDLRAHRPAGEGLRA